MEYALIWLINDIIAYTPPFVVLGAAWLLLGKFKPELTVQPRPSPDGGSAEKAPSPVPIVPFFISMYSLITLANIINQAIADYLATKFGTGELPDVFASLMPKNAFEWGVMLFFAGIAAPVAEEIIFRRLLLIPLRKLGNIPAIAITALSFGIFHQNLTQFFYAAVGGVILGIAAVRANSVVPAIIIHILSNSFDIVVTFLSESAEKAEFHVGVAALNLTVTALFFGGLITTAVLAVKGKFKT